MHHGLQLAAWHELFVATATAAAALLGLIFVAISFHMREIETRPTLRLRARLNLQALGAVLTVSLAALLPGQGPRWLGAELLAIAFAYFGLVVAGWRRTAREIHGLPADVRFRVLLQNSVLILQIAAGVSLMIGRGPGLYLEAPMVLLALPVTIFNAWNIVFARELGEP
jgi:hypothetical protein